MLLGVLTSRSWRGAGLATGVTVGETSGGAAENDGGTYVGASLQGFGTSAINPKGMLLYLALTPEFIRPHAGFSVPVQSAIFGPMFVASAAIIYTLIAAGSRRLLRSRPGAARGITLTSGIIMCLLGGVPMFFVKLSGWFFGNWGFLVFGQEVAGRRVVAAGC
ncbi:MAG: hypothetical protein M3017_02185 [Actinomycetota bacterium]|nr:hypothetical protein [Actinomycetota bacterium]